MNLVGGNLLDIDINIFFDGAHKILILKALDRIDMDEPA